MTAREFPAPSEPDQTRPSGHCGHCGREITKRDALWMVGDNLACSMDCSNAIWAESEYNPHRIEPSDPVIVPNPKEEGGGEYVVEMTRPGEYVGTHRARMPATPFADIAPHQSSSPTSTKAGEVKGKTARSQMSRILHFIETQGLYGATRQEIVDALSISLQAVCGRVRRLYQMGLIGSNCEKGCFYVCDEHPVISRKNRLSGLDNEVLVPELYVRRWYPEQARPAMPLAAK